MKKFILSVVYLFFVNIFFAKSSIIVEHYSTDNGVLHETVNCVLKSSEGFMWFGTWYGLCSFDGVKFKAYNLVRKNQKDIPPRKIQNIFEDKFGNLWIKTIDHKLYIFDKKREFFTLLSNQLSQKFSVNSQVIKIMPTENGGFLLLTKDKDLLLATPTENASASINLLLRSDVKIAGSKLMHSIFGESNDYLIWIGSNFSLIFCPKGNKSALKTDDYFLKKISKIPHSTFTSAFKQNNILWLGDAQGNILRINFENGNIDLLDKFRGDGEVQNIMTDKSQLYVSIKEKGIFSWNLVSNTVSSIANSPIDIVQSFSDSEGIIWFVTSDKGVIAYDKKINVARTFDFPGNDYVNENISWQDGKKLGMFFLSRAGQVFRIDRQTMTSICLNDQIKNAQTIKKISNILFDENGILWLTSYDDGVFRMSFPKQQFNLLNVVDMKIQEISTVQSGGIKALFQNKNGDIWVGTRKSEVFQFSREGKIKHRFSKENYNIGNVYHIMQDRQGCLWFSTKGQGLVKAFPDESSSQGFKFTRYTHDDLIPSSISGNDIYCTFQDSKGRIWVGAFGGGLNLLQQDGNTVIFKHKYNSFNKYPEYGQYVEVRNIIEDKTGRIWVGTSDGLMSFDGNFDSSDKINFEIYRNGESVYNDDVYSLYKDEKNRIWVSIFGIGLNELTGYDSQNKYPKLISYGLKSGLNGDVVLSIIGDRHNNIWLSTESGISRFDLSSKMFRNFDKYDGFPSIKMEEESAILRDDGIIWFGSKEGILQFDPQKIVSNDIVYPTYIVDIKVSNQDYEQWNNDSISVKYIDKISLKHNQSMFTIEFAALNYYNQNHIAYNYILDGYEKEWHFNGKNRIASYTNVPPGKYFFKVRTIDETNPDLISEKMLHITILPPWWKTAWAYSIYVILFIVLLYGVFRFIKLMIKMRNDVYIEQTLSDLKIKFFTNVSHELRTPLTLIKAPIQELKDNELLSDKGKQYITLMENSTNQMLNLVNQILDFRKIENKKMRLHISPISLDDIIKSFYEEFLVLANESNINYHYVLLSENMVVWADKEKLETVIRNILSNAFKFTPVGGSVLITAGADDVKQQFFINVQDSGVGIPSGEIDKIFERFSQGNNTQNIGYPGTGIGLALSRELIQLHHGDIKVESVENKGTIFTVEIPFGKKHFKESDVDFYISDIVADNVNAEAETDIDTVIETTEADSHLDLPVLLIVEDNKALCNLMKLQLEDKYRVLIAYNGKEGLKKINLYYPDIIITDQMMPEMDGLEMLSHIRNDFNISHIPVIMLTAKNDDENKIESIHLGANAYITKPFNKKYLIARIEQLLNERKLFRERFLDKDQDTEESINNYGNFFVEKDVEFLNKIRQIIEDNLDNSDFNIDTIASSVNLSRSAFFKKLKSITGLAPVDLVKDIRLNKAVEMMKHSDLSISEIAFAVGFKDAGYFGKCFRKKYQMSPRDYLSQLHKS